MCRRNVGAACGLDFEIGCHACGIIDPAWGLFLGFPVLLSLWQPTGFCKIRFDVFGTQLCLGTSGSDAVFNQTFIDGEPCPQARKRF